MEKIEQKSNISSKPQRDITIDILRTLALLCIILAHVESPDILARIRIFDVVCMVVLVGMSYSMSDKKQNYIEYIKKRFKRLVLPTWYFLLFFFLLLLIYQIKNNINMNAGLLWKSFTFSLNGGIGYVWIIRIYMWMALISPGIRWISCKIKNNVLYLLVVLLTSGIYWVVLHQYDNLKGIFIPFIFDYFIIYVLGYGIIAALGYRYKELTGLERIILQCILLVVLIVQTNIIGFKNIVNYKYPPQSFYIVYGLWITFVLYDIFRSCNKFRKIFGNKAVLWISKNSLWIYLWHIVPLYLLKYFDFGFIESNFVTRWIFTFLFAIICTVLQNDLKKLFVMKITQHRNKRKDEKMDIKKIKNVKFKSFIICISIYLVLVGIKLIFVVNNRSMPQVSDEFLYIRFCKELAANGSYNSVQYPILYPIFLLPSLLFGEHYYMAMKVLNVLYSSLLPITVFLLSKLYLDTKKSAFCAIFSAIVPFHFVMPMTIMSENIYFPLLVLTMYITLRDYKNKILGDVLLGILLGMLYLTRHISFVVLPVFALTWFLKQLNDKVKILHIFARGILIIGTFVLVYTPWLYMGISHGFGVKATLGFAIASTSVPEQLTAKRLVMSAVFYLSYYAIILAPLMSGIIRSFTTINWKKLTCAYNQLWVLIVGLAAAFWVAVTRHSWKVAYNYPEFLKIKGRYLIYFPTLFFILVMVTLFIERKRIQNNIANIIITYILPVFLIVAGYMIVIKGSIQPLTSYFIGNIESSDGQRIKLLDIWYIVIACLCMCIFMLIYDYGTRWTKSTLAAVFALEVSILQIQGIPQYLGFLNEMNEEQNNTINKYFHDLKETVDRIGKDRRIAIYVETMDSDKKFVSRSFNMYGYDNVILFADMNVLKSKIYYVLTDKPDEYDYDKIIEEYDWGSNDFYLLQMTNQNAK